MNPFIVYIEVFGLRMHLLSAVFGVTAIMLAMTLQLGRFPIHIAMLNAALLVQIGNFGYELLWITFGGGALVLYSLVLVMLLLILDMMNSRLHFAELNKITLILFGVCLASLTVMYAGGWFDLLHAYDIGLGADPHNLVWAVGKAAGLMMPVTLLRR
jgi:hypothetical protein